MREVAIIILTLRGLWLLDSPPVGLGIVFVGVSSPQIAPFCSVKRPERLILEIDDLAKRFRRDGILAVSGFRCFPCNKRRKNSMM